MCATERVRLEVFIHPHFGQAKVGKLDMAVLAYQNIVRLQVSVKNSVFV